MITFEDWKKALDEGNTTFFIVDKERRTYEKFYCLGATDYVFDKHGNTYLSIGRFSPKGLKITPAFFKAEDCFLGQKEAEKQLAWYLDNNVFQAIKLTYEESKDETMDD